MALEWARVLKNDGVKVHLIDPGRVQTKLGVVGDQRNDDSGLKNKKATGALPAHIPADFIKRVAEGEKDDQQGLLHSMQGVQPW